MNVTAGCLVNSSGGVLQVFTNLAIVNYSDFDLLQFY